MKLKKIERAIEHLKNKIKKQGMITNARDENQLDNLQQLYISKLNESNDSIVIDDIGQVYNPEKVGEK